MTANWSAGSTTISSVIRQDGLKLRLGASTEFIEDIATMRASASALEVRCRAPALAS